MESRLFGDQPSRALPKLTALLTEREGSACGCPQVFAGPRTRTDHAIEAALFRMAIAAGLSNPPAGDEDGKGLGTTREIGRR